MASAPKTEDPDLSDDVWDLMSEFAELNRRRLFGGGDLPAREHERWTVLRGLIETHFDGKGRRVRNGGERRIHPRLPTHIQVRFEAAGSGGADSILDISRGGVFVATDSPHAMGENVELHLEDPDGEKLVALHGVVRWIRGPGGLGEPGGMGIEFGRLSPAERRAVDSLLSLWTDELDEAEAAKER